MYRGTYTLIGLELSMFTRKLEAQLRYQRIPYEWMYKGDSNAEAVESRSGSRFIPVLKTPDSWMISDTISLGPMLHHRFSTEPVIPETPAQRASCFVLEDFFNHWFPRHALHSRWCYPDNVEAIGRWFGCNQVLGKSLDSELTAEEEAQVAGVGKHMHDAFGAGACEVQGVGVDKKAEVQADLSRILSLVGDHLENHSFLLGERACLADFALVGPLKAHFLQDPEPRSWLEKNGQLEIMKAYVDRVWNPTTTPNTWLEQDQIPVTVYALFAYAQKTYQLFARNSIEAAARGEKFVEMDLGDGPFTSRSMKRLDKSRLHVQDELLSCGAENTELASHGVLDFYLAPAIIK